MITTRQRMALEAAAHSFVSDAETAAVYEANVSVPEFLWTVLGLDWSDAPRLDRWHAQDILEIAIEDLSRECEESGEAYDRARTTGDRIVVCDRCGMAGNCGLASSRLVDLSRLYSVGWAECDMPWGVELWCANCNGSRP